VEQLLNPYQFARCNASYLVNLRYVDKVEDNTVYIGGTQVNITRGKKKTFMKTLIEYLGVSS
jgi:DNA-binding LytR/AlgR family response regulator